MEMTEDSRPEIQFIPTQEIRFEQVDIDLKGISKINDLSGLLENAKTDIPDIDEESSYILRIVLKGRTPLHVILNNAEQIEEVRNNLNEGKLSEEYFTWIDSILWKHSPISMWRNSDRAMISRPKY